MNMRGYTPYCRTLELGRRRSGIALSLPATAFAVYLPALYFMPAAVFAELLYQLHTFVSLHASQWPTGSCGEGIRTYKQDTDAQPKQGNTQAFKRGLEGEKR